MRLISSVPTPVKVAAVSGLTAILVACGSFGQPVPQPTPTNVYNTSIPTSTATPTPEPTATPEPRYIPNSPEEVRLYLTQALNLGESYFKRRAETGVEHSEDLNLAFRIARDVAIGITRHNADNPDMLYMRYKTCAESAAGKYGWRGMVTEEQREESLLEIQENKIKASEEFQTRYVNEINRINLLATGIQQNCIAGPFNRKYNREYNEKYNEKYDKTYDEKYNE